MSTNTLCLGTTIVLTAALLSSIAVGVSIATSGPDPNQVDISVNALMLAYRTGPYAVIGAPYADGVKAYYEMYSGSERSGEVKIHHLECETGYNSNKAIPCLESAIASGRRPSWLTPLSTSATEKLRPKLLQHEIPQLMAGYGDYMKFNATSQEQVYRQGPYTRLTGPHYMNAIDSFLDMHKGKVAYLHLNLTYGYHEAFAFEKESRATNVPCNLFMAKDVKSAVDACWEKIDLDTQAVYLMPWGEFTHAFLEGSKRRGYPMSKIVSGWWGGYYIEEGNHVGIKMLSSADPTKVPTSLARQPVSNSVALGMRDAAVNTELVRLAAQSKSTDLSGMGIEAIVSKLNLTAARWTELGLKDFAAPCTAADCTHTFLLEWTADGWKRV